MLILDSLDGPDYRIKQRINNKLYEIRCWWNELSGSWFITFGLPAQAPLIKSRATVLRNILEPFQWMEGIPDGCLTVLDVEKGVGRPGRDDFGVDKRFKLVYIEREDIDGL